MRRKLVAVLLLAVIVFMMPLDAWAWDFKDKNAYPPPPGYGNLTYTRTQGAYIDFILVHPFSISSSNPEGGSLGDFGPTGPYRSTAEYLFAPDNRDAQGNLILGDGWGFINPKDGLTPPSSDLNTWLQALEWPKSGGWYNVTDAGAKQGSAAIRNIFYHMPYGTYIFTSSNITGASKTNPMLVSPGPNFDTVNDGQRDIRAAGNFPNNKPTYLFNLTKDAAIGLVHRLETLYPNMGVYWVPEVGYEHKKVAWTADLSVAQLTAGSPGSNGQAPFQAVVENLSPFDAVNALFTLYAWPEGEPKPFQVASQKVNIPRGSVAAGTPGALTINGFYAAPEGKKYTLIAAINAVYDPNGVTLGGVPGRWQKQLYNPTYNGQVPPGIGTFLEPYYDNNVKQASQDAYVPPSSDGGGGQGLQGSNDLAVTGLDVYDQNGNKVNSVVVGQGYKVKATFASSFPVNGFAFVRLYDYDKSNSMMYLVDRAYEYFHAGETLTVEWNWNPGHTQFKLIATVDYDYSNGNWVQEKFDGKYIEITYENNKLEKDYTGTSGASGPPPGEQQLTVGAYHPIVTKRVPVYRTVTREIVETYWQEVPLIPANTPEPKIRVRLIQ
ncbi:hypothetical protein MGLY_35100 (plasmid) [Neomoorella glycerini]|uniref:Uncharacterized protein n=1 Tax=Neomoorella glycerini TaxID=55779 RepID=A0A6I5ZWR9_9FIRM|nr:hypothetical protein [Moorella glycerini]QGP94085.1 hypothetical protein MGLY_35100 [Moorella glycerini]